MTGVEEAALVAAIAPEVAGGTAAAAGGMAAGEGLGMLTAAEAAGLMAPEVAGAGWATGAGEALGGGLGAAFGSPEAAAISGAAFGPESQILSMYGPQAMSGNFDAYGLPQVASPLTGGAEPFAAGATTTQPGVAGTFGPGTNQQGMDPKKLMKLGQLLAQMGGGGQQQQGGPTGSSYEPPSMRAALMTQEQITKKWLLKNDPSTYRRIYGEPTSGG